MTLNIIKILRKGNLELFHSHMIGWLLNPLESHGLSETFLNEFLLCLGITRTNDLGKFLSIEIEVKNKNSRYDILLEFENQEIIIENKTKSIGNNSQLSKYKSQSKKVVGLGYTKYSFGGEVENIIITYRTLLSILLKIKKPKERNKYNYLIEDYCDHLLNDLDLIEQMYDLNEVKLEEIRKLAKPLEDNDLRFLLLNYFAAFKERNNLPNWFLNKNMISGVWCANFNDSNVFNENVSNLLLEYKNTLWFHVEISTSLLKSNSDIIGNIQLRSNIATNNSSFRDDFLSSTNLKESHQLPKTISNKYKTFYLVKENLLAVDLYGNNLYKKLEDFKSFFIKREKKKDNLVGDSTPG